MSDAASARATAAPAIEVLAPLVADQIAAGEVVERPASVVKELVENALDAGASQVEVTLRDGGRELVAVRDDGCGMHPQDALRACLRHATSKLRVLDDLARLSSHGFRGEALASIAAVAEVTITTRRACDAEATRVVVAGGAVRESAPAGAPPGTTVEVRGLFASVPARRKFLRSAPTESGHVVELLSRLALARPAVGLACSQGGRDLLRHPAVTRGEERLRQVLGAARAATMIAVAADEPGLALRGWVSRAGESLAQARGILTYVNGRLVRDRLLTRALLDAYRGLLPQGRYPAAVLLLEMPGTAVDVNVHPTKTEVRFAQGDAVYGAVLRGVRAALAAAAGAPGGARDSGDRARSERVAGEPAAPLVPSGERGAAAMRSAESAWADSAPGGDGAGHGVRVAEALSRYAIRAQGQLAVHGTASVAGGWGGPVSRAAAAADAGVTRASRGAAGEGGSIALPLPDSQPHGGDVAEEPTAAPRFAALRVIGQAFQGYLVCEAPDALVLIDQHAAHERVRFERLRAAAGRTDEALPSQRLLVARVVELGPAAVAQLLESAAELAAAGFEIEGFGDRALALRALPAALDVATDVEVVLADLARDLGSIGASERLQTARDALLARIACHGAVRAGDALQPREMEGLLADLDTIPFAATCPHGRPLVIELPRAELARRVRRS